MSRHSGAIPLLSSLLLTESLSLRNSLTEVSAPLQGRGSQPGSSLRRLREWHAAQLHRKLGATRAQPGRWASRRGPTSAAHLSPPSQLFQRLRLRFPPSQACLAMEARSLALAELLRQRCRVTASASAPTFPLRIQTQRLRLSEDEEAQILMRWTAMASASWHVAACRGMSRLSGLAA